jgi:hypothetical protein
MSFLSQMIRGEFEILCSTDPGVELSVDEERRLNTAAEKPRIGESSNGDILKESVTRRSKQSRMKSHPQMTPVSRNKFLDYISGETDIMCFSPTREDCSSDALCASVEGFVPNTDDELDDLIFIDVGKNRASPDNYLRKKSTPMTQGKVRVDFNTRSLTNETQSIVQKMDRPSPTSVLTGFANPTAFSNTSKAGNDFLKALYDRNNQTFVAQQLKSDDEESMDEMKGAPVRHLNFESAGFSPAESLSMKRHLKLQKVVRSLDAGLSKD